jgi:GT2 family glycosyltransferase
MKNTVIVDDSGNGEVRNELHLNYPQPHWIVHERNLGFGPSANEAVLACGEDIVILLNDDVQLLNNPCPKLAECFLDENLFAVTFRSENAKGEFREGAKRLVWKLGFPKILHNPKDQLMRDDVEQASSYAVGGHCAYRRAAFEKFAGFDKLFEPFYWEDVDLSVRAQKAGMKVLYAPVCRVLHNEDGAIRSNHKRDEIRRLTLRNRILFAQRHCPKSLRPLLNLNLALQKFTARIMSDHASSAAFREADTRWNDSFENEVRK